MSQGPVGLVGSFGRDEDLCSVFCVSDPYGSGDGLEHYLWSAIGLVGEVQGMDGAFWKLDRKSVV